MKQKISILFFLCLLCGVAANAQDDKADRAQDRAEKSAETKAKAKEKTEYSVFRRQILGLKEYSEERRKIPALQKANKGTTIKIVAIVDSADEDPDSKTLTGFIVQNIGDNSTNVYEVTYDRTLKKITAVKHTTEGVAADKEDAEDAGDKPEPKKATTHKKTKDDDGDDDDDDKPAKGKDKEDDKD